MPSLPSVSILMPVRNEGAYIRRSLNAVLAQDYPPELLQILVADGMSQDETRRVILAEQDRLLQGGGGPRLQLVDNPGRIVPTGMNAALPLAEGEIILRVDGHCEIASDYVRRCAAHLQADGVDGVGGSTETLGENTLARWIAAAMSSPFGVGGSAFRTLKGRTQLVDSIPFPAYTREAVQRAGLYDEELVRNQDDEYNYRLRGLGMKLLLAADVHSRYYSRGSLRALWRQYYQYGFWKVRVLQKHPRQMSLRQFIPPLFVLSLLLGAPLALAWRPYGGWLLGAAAGAYLLANLGAALWSARRSGAQALLYLPPVFAILHLSYGLGFLVGLVRFAHRWGDRTGKTPPWPADAAT